MSVSFALGVPGAGKGHVLKAVEKMPGKNYRIVNWGDMMLDIASKRYPDRVKERDDLRFKLRPSEQVAIQKEVGKTIAKMDDNLIVDTHCSIELPNGGYLPGLPAYVLAEMNGKVDRFLYVTAPAEQLFDRRSKDQTRKRPGSVESIAKHDQINRYFLAAYSTLTGAPSFIIENIKGKLEDAQGQLVEILQ